MGTPALEISQLMIGYPQKRSRVIEVAGPIDIRMDAGELHCLLGPNGVGKSTLLRTIAGVQPSLGGEVSILSNNINSLDKRKLAHMLSIVLTDRITHGNLTAYDLIALGRTPHTGWFGKLSKSDLDIIERAIESISIRHLQNKNIHELSDGERQKVMIARALAQDTPVILLDEPTAHLDLPNRIEIVRLLRKLARETGKAIVMSTHELDLALQAADKIWLMELGNKMHVGVPEDLVLQDIFGEVFSREGVSFDKRQGVFKVVEPHCADINVQGEKTGKFWTRRALERMGYTVFSDKQGVETVTVGFDNHHWKWQFSHGDQSIYIDSIAALEKHLKREEGAA